MKIEVNGIAKKYRNKKVLTDISFTAEAGKCVGILGANGCGKSTLLSILAGVQKADAGEFLYDSNNLFKYTAQRSKLIGYVPQGTPLIEELTAKDNLLLWYSKKDLKKELENGVLKMLGINDFLKVPVYKMSGGMKKRLSIGCSVCEHPPVLLLDEPMTALDLACKQDISNYLNHHKKSGGIAILVTHDVLELNLCDEYYILKDGVLTPFDFNGDIKRLVESL